MQVGNVHHMLALEWLPQRAHRGRRVDLRAALVPRAARRWAGAATGWQSSPCTEIWPGSFRGCKGVGNAQCSAPVPASVAFTAVLLTLGATSRAEPSSLDCSSVLV
jgi:hypothetical protein